MFKKIVDQQYPRLLTQVCRDDCSPFFGSFDRNWWHYRIRDFSSIMLQQGGYTSSLYTLFEDYESEKKSLLKLSAASAVFWNKRVQKRGAFEEYYPWENAYPPLAFSTLAIAKMVKDQVVEKETVITGLKKAAKQLQNRFEKQAGNQQLAGLAALAMIKHLDSSLVNESRFRELKTKTLALQNKEGWYTEYDGPDLGYLSVTLDCLWDLYNITGEQEYMVSAKNAMNFLHSIIAYRLGGIGMHNARNTDYLVPYGITRFLFEKDEVYKEKSQQIMSLIYKDMDEKHHFFNAIDDRYWSHYIGHSVVRAQLLLEKNNYSFKKEISIKPLEIPFCFPESGYLFFPFDENRARYIVNTKKGGVCTLYNSEQTLLNDYGWVLSDGKTQFVNHWWSLLWKNEKQRNAIVIEGFLFPHKEKTSTPFLHFGLRVVSFMFGSTLTRILRNILIFKSKLSNIKFTRSIQDRGSLLIITDQFEGIKEDMTFHRAPRGSKRHVASADSYNIEDSYLLHDIEAKEIRTKTKEGLIIETTYETGRKHEVGK